MGMPAELIFAIILMIIAIGIYVWGISRNFNKYKKAEEISGMVLMEIEPSKKEKFYRNASLILCVVLYFILRIKRGVMELSSLLILVGLFAASHLQYKNQKICEKGILVATGLVEWKNIESIEPVDEMTDKIKIHMREKVNGERKITLYCIPGEALNIFHLIEQKRMRENASFQNERYLQR